MGPLIEYLATPTLSAVFYTGIYIVFKHHNKIRVITSLINASILSAFALIPLNPDPVHLNGYITGYFIYDTAVGHFYDQSNFGFLSGYIHHPVYICLLTYLRITNESHLIQIFLPFEIPTAIQDVKKLTPSTVTDLAFGISFFTFRILYNIHVVTQMPNTLYASFVCLMLTLHIYWFLQWINRTPK